MLIRDAFWLRIRMGYELRPGIRISKTLCTQHINTIWN
jgi:hypothetical protein